ncbi:DNA-binding SARP family transcriptional activator/tetratricopeptide (TPR) repeat protein [Kitasatospora sp. MAA19]|uniref:AfsR/SARP family transcriptional regulator n=1 Tax=Kitasatospora sp. MAA19 TaxID=3035090 RepID=UPI002474D871|nr:AfsR/SARP family transcriptional regulator [Kitasatospora sp. MAA19]MDH6710863.1 DNA-binding SARP family transcriptional activator/tetratricopeptide (TPR) repeat protein [Kitasatospora sp. MAA19]
MGELRFAVLGPVRGWRDGGELALGSPQQRSLLLSLLLRANHTVSLGQLVDDLWGEDPPAKPTAVIRTYVHRLRRILGPTALTSLGGGYLLTVDPGGLDIDRCEELVGEAKELRGAGEHAHAAATLRSVLALWQGEPMSGLPGPYAERQRGEWAERRVTVLESCLEAEVEAGPSGEAVAELTAVAAEHPLRERFSELLMLALYRAGRQAEALSVYRTTDRRLQAQLGVAAGPGLRELQRRILVADATLVTPALLAPSAPRTGTAAARPPYQPPAPPTQVPADLADFTGREAQTEALRTVLLAPRTVPVATVSGLGGVGKTALAVHVAHGLAADFPDGQLYVDLHGADGHPTPPEEVLGAFLRALGVPADTLPVGPAERSAQFRSLLSGRRVLVVLDNARDAEQIRPLLPGRPGCAVLVTSRARLGSLPNAHVVELPAFAPEEALGLLGQVVGEQRLRAEPDTAGELVRLCGHLPLAVRILAARLACRPDWSMARLLDKLSENRLRLDVLRTGDLAVESAFRFGYDQLTSDQARAFRLLAVPDVPDLSPGAVAAVLGLPEHAAEELAESLVDCSMLETAPPDRYRFHDLLRAFAQRLTPDTTASSDAQAEADRPAAVLTRLAIRHHAETIAALGPSATRAALPGAGALHAPDSRAVARGRGEYHGIGALVGQYAGLHEPTRLDLVAELLLGCSLLCETGQATRPLGHAAKVLLQAAVRQGDRTAEVRARLVLGRLLTEVGSEPAALGELLRSRDLCTAHDLPGPLLALAHASLAALFVQAGRPGDAVDGFTAAISVWERLGDRRSVAGELLNLAGAFTELGRFEAAVRVVDQSLLICHHLADHELQALALDSLGTIAHDRGEFEQALRHHRGALALLRPDDRRRTGRTLLRLTESLRAVGRSDEAVEAADRAVEVLTLDGDRRGRGLALAALGDALADRDATEDAARACRSEAYDILAAIGSPEADRLHALIGLGRPADRPRRQWPSWLPA